MNTVNFTVFDASNGKSFKMEAPNNGSIEIVKKKVNDIFLIENKYQIILFGDKNDKYRYFTDTNNLEILDNKNIFVYNRLNINNINNKKNELSIIFEQEEFQPINEKNTKTILIKERNNIDNNAIKGALIIYEIEFIKKLNELENVIEYMNKNIKIIDNIICEQENQLEGIRAVVSNLILYNENFNYILELFNEKIQYFEYFNDIFNKNFEKDVENLRYIKLHEKIKNETYKQLIDYISVEQQRLHLDECNKQYKIFVKKFENLSNINQKSNENIKKIIELKEYFNILQKINEIKNDYEKLIKEVDNYIIIKDNFKIHIELIQKSLDEYNNENNLKTCHTMDNFFQDYKYIGSKIDNTIDNIYLTLNDTKKECNKTLNKTLNDTSFYQNEISNIKIIFNTVEKISLHIQNNLYIMSTVSNIPNAYKQSIFEIIRRKKFKKEYTNQISLMIKNLAKIRDDEIQKRAEFNNKYSYYLPSNYINLNEIPSEFNIKFEKFDENLPEFEDNYDFVDEIINNIVENVIEQISDDESVIYCDSDNEVENEYISYFNKIVKNLK